MKKILISSLLAITLIGLTGCGESTDDGKINLPSGSHRYDGVNYQEVITDLEDAGFTNVQTVALDDLVTGWLTDDGEVESVAVDGDTTFSSDDRYDPNIEIVITYHTFAANDNVEEPKIDEPVIEPADYNEAEVETTVPTIQLANSFEEAVWDAVDNNYGELTSIALEDADMNADGQSAYRIEIICGESYITINPLIEAIASVMADNSATVKSRVIFNNDEGYNLRVLEIAIDGTVTPISQTTHYKDERYEWMSSLFSVWDGSCDQLNDLIVDNLNDEKSFEHIETTYVDIYDADTRDTYADVLSQAGIDFDIEVGDIWIQTEFSAKNSFGGTVKNTAFAIASWSVEDVILLSIE